MNSNYNPFRGPHHNDPSDASTLTIIAIAALLAAWLLLTGCKSGQLETLGDKLNAKATNEVGQAIDGIDINISGGGATLPTPDSTTTTVPSPDSTSTDADEAANGFSLSGTITHKLTVSKVTSSMIYFGRMDLDWPEKDECCGESRLGVLRDGKWWGPHKMDHVRPSSSSRDWKNVDGSYGKFSEYKPVTGDKCVFVLVSYDGKKRTNGAFFVWP